MSQVSGHVILENDKIFVSNVLELVNVDNSTGDIDYEGDVVVKGNVLAGFTVKATGDITSNYQKYTYADKLYSTNIMANAPLSYSTIDSQGDTVTQYYTYTRKTKYIPVFL